MSARSHLLIPALLPALAACQGPIDPPKPPVSTTTTTVATRSEAVTATPTGERGIYQVYLGMERITQVQIVSTKDDAADDRTVDPTRWSFDTATGRLHVDALVDDSHQRVVVLGVRRRPPEWMLDQDADLHSVRVVIGDHLGVEGRDYAIDREAGLLRLLGADTPEAPLSYYVQYSLCVDPAHPERALGVAFGNHEDQRTVRRLLGIEPR